LERLTVAVPTPPAVARKGMEKPRAGILVQEPRWGLGDGRDGLQHAL